MLTSPTKKRVVFENYYPEKPSNKRLRQCSFHTAPWNFTCVISKRNLASTKKKTCSTSLRQVTRWPSTLQYKPIKQHRVDINQSVATPPDCVDSPTDARRTATRLAPRRPMLTKNKTQPSRLFPPARPTAALIRFAATPLRRQTTHTDWH